MVKKVPQEYRRKETITDAARRQMVNILVADMIDNHGYVCSIFFLFVANNLMAIAHIWITSLISPLRCLSNHRKQSEESLLWV